MQSHNPRFILPGDEKGEYEKIIVDQYKEHSTRDISEEIEKINNSKKNDNSIGLVDELFELKIELKVAQEWKRNALKLEEDISDKQDERNRTGRDDYDLDMSFNNGNYTESDPTGEITSLDALKKIRIMARYFYEGHEHYTLWMNFNGCNQDISYIIKLLTSNDIIINLNPESGVKETLVNTISEINVTTLVFLKQDKEEFQILLNKLAAVNIVPQALASKQNISVNKIDRIHFVEELMKIGHNDFLIFQKYIDAEILRLKNELRLEEDKTHSISAPKHEPKIREAKKFFILESKNPSVITNPQESFNRKNDDLEPQQSKRTPTPGESNQFY